MTSSDQLVSVLRSGNSESQEALAKEIEDAAYQEKLSLAALISCVSAYSIIGAIVGGVLVVQEKLRVEALPVEAVGKAAIDWSWLQGLFGFFCWPLLGLAKFPLPMPGGWELPTYYGAVLFPAAILAFWVVWRKVRPARNAPL